MASMKTVLLRDRFTKACLLASKIISTKSNLPILSNLLFTAKEDNSFTIEASNLELSLRLQMGVKVEEPGKITVPARKFTEYLSMLASEQLQLSLDRKHIVVQGDENEARFVTMPADDFPVLPEVESTTPQLVVDEDQLRPVIKQTVFAAASGEAHPILSGVLFEFHGEKDISVVTTDSFRLSLSKLLAHGNIEKSFIVPAAALMEVERLLGDVFFASLETKPDQITLQMSGDDNQIFFKYGEVEVMARLLEADYPDYKRVFPAELTTSVVIDRNLLVQAIKRTAIFAAREGQAIKLKLDNDQQAIELTAQSAEVGSHTGAIPVQIEGDMVELGFNSRYLLDGLESFTSDQVIMKVKDAASPVLIHRVDDTQYQHIVMPMSLNNM